VWVNVVLTPRNSRVNTTQKRAQADTAKRTHKPRDHETTLNKGVCGGAGGGTRTRMSLTSLDFESTDNYCKQRAKQDRRGLVWY